MLLIENNNGDVKEISVFNGKQSSVWTTKEETAITTAANDNILITAEIDAKEGRYAMEVYLPNTFIPNKSPTRKRERDYLWKLKVS